MTEQKKYSNKVVSVIMIILGGLGLVSSISGLGSVSSAFLPSSIAELVASALFALTGILGLAFLENKSKYGICKAVNWLSILVTIVACIMVCMVFPSMELPAELAEYVTKYAQYIDIVKGIILGVVIAGSVLKLIFNLLYFSGIKKNENM